MNFFLRLLFQCCLIGMIVLMSNKKTVAQDLDPPKYELRGAWIATVYKLDWPTSNTESSQKRQLRKHIVEV